MNYKVIDHLHNFLGNILLPPNRFGLFSCDVLEA